MDDKEDIKIGDIVPLHSHSFGKSFARCMDIRYGVIIAFTNANNPRVIPIYYKTPQTFTHKGAFAWARKRSTIVPNSMCLSEKQKDKYLSGGKRQKNYNRILSAALRDIRMRKKVMSPSVSAGTKSYFTFD